MPLVFCSATAVAMAKPLDRFKMEKYFPSDDKVDWSDTMLLPGANNDASFEGSVRVPGMMRSNWPAFSPYTSSSSDGSTFIAVA